MYKKTYTKTYSKIKLFLFLIINVFIFYVYTRTMPMGDVHEKAYMIHFFSILFSFIIMMTILIIDIQDYSKEDWIIAGILGLISLGNPYPIHLMGILKGICVFFSYIASKTLFGQYTTRMEMFNFTNLREVIDDLKWIAIVTGSFIILVILTSGMPIQFDFQPNMLFRALSAGISEEIIFRLFLFSVIVQVSKGNVESNILTILIMILPFSIFHLVDMGVYQGFMPAFINSANIFIMAIPITLLALKRNVFSAIVVHFLIDLFIFTFTF